MAQSVLETISSLLGEMTATTITIVGILLVLSFISWIVILWKALQFWKIKRQGTMALRTIEETGDLKYTAAFFRNQRKSSPFSRVFSRSMHFHAKLVKVTPQQQTDDEEFGPPVANPSLQPVDLDGLSLIIEHEIGEERKVMAAGLGWLPLIAHVAPLLGLLGTCTGIMSTFLGVKNAGVTSIAAIAPGVSEALITTIAGLIVAIPAAVGKHVMHGRMAELEEMLEWFANELISSIIDDIRGRA